MVKLKFVFMFFLIKAIRLRVAGRDVRGVCGCGGGGGGSVRRVWSKPLNENETAH